MSDNYMSKIKAYAKGVTSRKADTTDDVPPMPKPRPQGYEAEVLKREQDKKKYLRSPEESRKTYKGDLEYPGYVKYK